MHLSSEIKTHGFYPLVQFREDKFGSDGVVRNATRRVIRNVKYDDKWYAPALPALFGRQVGKLLSRKMKPLMQLPYCLEVCETQECEDQYHLHEEKYRASLLPNKKKEVNLDAIEDAILYGEE